MLTNPLHPTDPATSDAAINELTAKISEHSYAERQQVLSRLLPIVAVYQSHAAEIERRGADYIAAIRASEKQGGVEQFISQFGLKEQEAIGLLCLAEALLRIPDRETADALIVDKLSGANWRKFIKEHSSFSLNARSWGLMLSTKLSEWDKSEKFIEHSMHQLSEPVIRKALKAAMHLLGGEFVAGKTIKDALKHTKAQRHQGYSFSFDMLGEGARTQEQAEHYTERYLEALDYIYAGEPKAAKADTAHYPLAPRTNISVKLSALDSRYEYLQKEELMERLYPKLKEICLRAHGYGLTISIDAEESYRLDLELELFAALLDDSEMQEVEGIGFVLQAYQKRAIFVLDWLAAQARKHQRVIPVRLVKGAYWDSEVKWAQMEGLADYPVFTRKSDTDVSYLACAARLLEQTDLFYPQFATHNAMTVAAIMTLAEQWGKQGQYEFQRLYGMGDAFYDHMIETHACRIYAPVGPFEDLLPYLIRRLMENGANSNFVHQLLDRNAEITTLLRNPIDASMQERSASGREIPIPTALFSDRENSRGYNLGCKAHLAQIEATRSPFQDTGYGVEASIGDEQKAAGASVDIASPGALDDVVGTVAYAGDHTLAEALAVAQQGQSAWAATPTKERANIIERLADLIAEHEGQFFALLAREAGKTLADAIAEIREAQDFCRYYAAQMRGLAPALRCESYTGEYNHLSYAPRGIVACISPWNFPLAIFTGQVVAVLLGGNAVIAKPAEATSIIASELVTLAYEAGVPRDALVFTPAEGKRFGEVVLSSSAIDAVAFTGSTETARRIAQSLLHREGAALPKLIAETGGQNAMIVDSSALLEQAVDDIVQSAFGSAGQRCSALRMLYVQEEVYASLKQMILGKMALLSMGNPWDRSTDIGPVISAQAKAGLEAHISRMREGGYAVHQAESLPNTPGHWVAPHLIEINHASQIGREQFGPILHMIRYKADQLDGVIDQINGTGYGLTFGIHSRIAERIEAITRRIHVGNIYVNRSMTGAVVGVQPFGGMGLSGTGPKAGGPDYLKAFMHERHVSDNVTAIGGNLELLRYCSHEFMIMI